MGPDALVQVPLHPGEVAAQPPQALGTPQQGRVGVAVDHLKIPDRRGQGLRPRVVADGEARRLRGGVDLSAVGVNVEPHTDGKLSHGSASSLSVSWMAFSTCSAVRIPSAAAERMPPA